MQLLRAVGVWWLASQCLGFNVLAVAAESAPNTSPYKERRLALVIGNSAYEAAPLRNPVNDARDFAAALADSGFEVTRLENASLRELRTALRDFGDRLKKQGGVGLFYFAGHGMQVKGRNYLIPVAAQIEREDEVEFESLDANLVLEKLDSAGNRFNIVILDACRNNPFARSFRSSTQGLAQMDAPSGAVVAFATSPGSVASDGGGRNGLYSQHLIESVRRPGLKIEEVFKQVRAAVRRDSNGMQTPWESTSLEGDFYFHPVDVAAAETARKQQEQARLEEAIRIAVAQERERIRKEFEAAQATAGRPVLAFGATEPTLPTAAPSVVTSPNPSTAPTMPVPTPATVANAAAASTAPTTVGRRPVPSESGEASSQVIGTRVEGKISAPQIAVGDEWQLLRITTNPTDRASQPLPIVEKITAVNVLPRRWSLSRVTLDKPDGQAVSTPTNYSVNAEPDALFMLTVGVSGQQKIAFPLEANATWSHSLEFEVPAGSPYNYGNSYKVRVDTNYKVVGWEQVTVPAGTFWALKIERRGWLNNLWQQPYLHGAAQVRSTLWYSPEVKYVVKSIANRYSIAVTNSASLIDSATTVELIRFTSADSKASGTRTANP
jgi:uncharacterized caspase-like protein